MMQSRYPLAYQGAETIQQLAERWSVNQGELPSFYSNVTAGRYVDVSSVEQATNDWRLVISITKLPDGDYIVFTTGREHRRMSANDKVFRAIYDELINQSIITVEAIRRFLNDKNVSTAIPVARKHYLIESDRLLEGCFNGYGSSRTDYKRLLEELWNEVRRVCVAVHHDR